MAAGPLRIELRRLETGSISAGGVELVRRAYFAVRDPAWETVEPQVLSRKLERNEHGFVLHARCRYRADAIDLDAELEIAAWDDGHVRFGSTAVATSSFAYNRIGFCLHHPPAELVGATLQLDGDQTFEVPSRILPQRRAGETFAPAVGPFGRMTVTGSSGARVEFRFAGDEFELEDQRNWTDGSFKTYGTPLSHGPPPPLTPGDRLTQSVELRLLDPPRRRPPTPAVIPELRLGNEAAIPRIGFAAGSPLADIGLAKALRPSHLRVDLRDGRAALDAAIGRAAAQESGIQLGLHLPLTEAERAELAGVQFDGLLRSVLVLHQDVERITGVEDADEARGLVGATGETALLWTGTDAYYAQLNRGLRPGLGTHLTFSMHPQEHASDEQSIVETLEIQRDVVLDLKAKQPGCHVSLGAVTFARRRNFSAPPGVVVEEPAPDRRQSGRFGAVWTLASVRYLAEAGVEESTYHSLAGPGGLIDSDGRATPLLRLFADLAELGNRAAVLESTAPLACTGLAFRSAGSLAFLVANLRAEPLRVRLPPAAAAKHGDVLDLEPHEYVRLEVAQ